MATYQTLLFDLDGTLSDPLPGFARSINYALESVGLDTRSQQELAQYIGPPLEGTLEALTQSDNPDLIAVLVAKYRERYLDVGYGENALYPGVIDALQELQSAGQRMAVCTSKPERTARLVLDLFELDGYFGFVSGGGIGVAKWMQIEQLLARSSICARTVMIGDRAIDLSAGHRNDVFAGGVLWGYGTCAELEAESPAHLYEHPSDWLSLLD